MSEIYVKWDHLRKHSDQMNSCARRMKEYMSRVDDIKNSLRLSDSVSSQIKKRLATDSNNLGHISDSMGNISETLNTIADSYRDTERQMLDN